MARRSERPFSDYEIKGMVQPIGMLTKPTGNGTYQEIEVRRVGVGGRIILVPGRVLTGEEFNREQKAKRELISRITGVLPRRSF